MRNSNLNIVGIIPARGGSKRIPKKNLKLLKGKPLIAHTIIEAKKSRFLNSLYVSTDDDKIALVSKSYGVDVIKRPKKLAQDTTQGYVPIQHAIKHLESKFKQSIDVVVVLQPTSPLRKSVDIDFAISEFIKNDCDSLVSVTDVCFPPEFMYKIKNKKLYPILKTKLKSKRIQDIPKTFQINGAVYVTKTKFLLKYNSLFSQNPCFYLMPFERSIDIDSIHDFEFCKLFL
ncbi:MAG: acylneuraminate cytidylyltransferase family protein [Nitrosopumilus sp.]|nr:acylneuraminate cytidylyltransferase family protein [Nitrosopumilus sp.]